MNIKKIVNTTLLFIAQRLTEILGFLIFSAGIILLISLISYSPEDPNFIFPKNTEIKNFLGIRGSYISDIFFQSIGLISYLISLTLIFTGINIISKKDFFLLIENIFYSILYSIFGSLFLNHFYNTTFALFINGNGGFIGNYLNENFFSSLINLNENIFYYFLIILIIIFFLLSINFSPNKFYNFFRKINLFNSKKKQNLNRQ